MRTYDNPLDVVFCSNSILVCTGFPRLNTYTVTGTQHVRTLNCKEYAPARLSQFTVESHSVVAEQIHIHYSPIPLPTSPVLKKRVLRSLLHLVNEFRKNNAEMRNKKSKVSYYF